MYYPHGYYYIIIILWGYYPQVIIPIIPSVLAGSFKIEECVEWEIIDFKANIRTKKKMKQCI